jgi:hypothetical protein
MEENITMATGTGGNSRQGVDNTKPIDTSVADRLSFEIHARYCINKLIHFFVIIVVKK